VMSRDGVIEHDDVIFTALAQRECSVRESAELLRESRACKDRSRLKN
jgi:hypothetical protein